MNESRRATHEGPAIPDQADAIGLARRVIQGYCLADLQPTLEAAERLTKNQHLNAAVFGRFKAGKSSFLNHILGRAILPVGVVPVTSVVTEISYDAQESAQVIFLNGKPSAKVPLGETENYISEATNPENAMGVERVRLFLPEMAPYKALRLVDTPGLESNLLHNTETSLAWSPNTDLALVAVGVDPPLTQQDVALIERLRRFTPNVSVLLTKMDLLEPAERREILDFVRGQLRTKFPDEVPVFAYSIKPGCQEPGGRNVKEWLTELLESFRKARSGALARKLLTLLTSAGDYLQLAMSSAEAKEADREELRARVLGNGQSCEDLHAHLGLIAARQIARTRPLIEDHLREHAQARLGEALKERLAAEFPRWQGSLAKTVRQFQRWLARELTEELAVVSARGTEGFLQPMRDARRLSQGVLQSFRDQLSERVQRAFGFSLRTTEAEIEVEPPRVPDVSISKVFNHDWDLVFALIPTVLIRSILQRSLAARVEEEVFKNLSRLTSQWDEAVCDAIRFSEREAHRRAEELVTTVRRLLGSEEAVPVKAIQRDLHELRIQMERLARPMEAASNLEE